MNYDMKKNMVKERKKDMNKEPKEGNTKGT